MERKILKQQAKKNLKGHCEKVPAVRLFYLFGIRKVTAVATTLFIANLLQLLWALTIIGGVIKFYSYRMVPFILAENPALKSRDVITLSRQMMDGYKWQCFVLDLSFLAWEILNILSFGIVGIFYLNPYKLSTVSEFFVKRRFDAKVKEIPNIHQLNDIYLYEKPENRALNQAYANQLALQKERIEKPELDKLSGFFYCFLGIRRGNDPKLLAYDVSGEGLLVFGLGGLAVVYVVAPMLDAVISRISRKNIIALCLLLLSVFSVDQVYSSKNPNMGEGVTDYAFRIDRVEYL